MRNTREQDGERHKHGYKAQWEIKEHKRTRRKK